MKKRLYKSTKDRKICGVCGGVAEYFDVDPTIVRVIYVVLSLAYGGGILLYFICALIMSNAPSSDYVPSDEVKYTVYENNADQNEPHYYNAGTVDENGSSRDE